MKILLATLNWGLGHATRDIPLIRHLISRGDEVLLAGDGASLVLLQKEFPTLASFELPAYNIAYPGGKNLTFHLFLQSMGVWKAILKEHAVLEKIVKKHSIDVVISDSRFGCYSKKVKSVLVTHQLSLESPLFKGLLNRINQRFLKRFSEVWIPDVPGDNNLSGKLSQLASPPVKVRYLGILSRFENQIAVTEEPGFILAIVSGPETQRTLFEKELLSQLEKLNRKVVLLQGLPGQKLAAGMRGKLTVFPHLPGKEIEKMLQKAELVISRSGYTTVMDLCKLDKKALLIPTPGQPEQEYLAEYYREKGWWIIQEQGHIDVQAALQELEGSKTPDPNSSELLANVLDSLKE